MKLFIIRYVGNNKEYQFECRNISNFDQSIDIPVQAFGLPEYSTDSATLTKAEGNIEKINFTWTIMNEETSPVFDGSGNNLGSWTRAVHPDGTSGGTWDLKTADGLFVFFTNVFEKIGISDNFKFQLVIEDDDGVRYTLKKYGIIQRIGIQKSANDPATYIAMIEFQVGDDVTIGSS